MKGDKGRQVNLSAWRAVPGIQAGRQRETNEGRQRETSESVRRVPGIQAGRQRETTEGIQRDTTESVRLESRARHPCWDTTGDK